MAFFIGYLAFLNAVSATFGSAFMLGLANSAVQNGWPGTALAIAMIWILVLPLNVCAALVCGKSFFELIGWRKG